MSKFNKKPNWKPEDGAINREFFKWLGNLSENDLKKLAIHILNCSNDKRIYSYPKVTIKGISSVLPSCYTAKEWIERQKRKMLVKKELNIINHELGLFNAAESLRPKKWKFFKRNNITTATMNVFLEQPGEEYFGQAKKIRNKNRKAIDLSPYAVEFFKVFLQKR